jgi:serine/threonine protein kinase
MNAPQANHPSPADLAAFATGRLRDADARVVATHLESCPDCCRAAASASGDSFVARVRDARPSQPPGSTHVPGAGAPSLAGPPPDLPPELVNHPRYRILRELGRGGMGVVYQARQTAMNRQVVVKVISRALLDNPDAVERFRREVHAAASLAHPNIVTAHDAEQVGDLHMLVMEFVPGQSLAELLQKKGPLPVREACHYGRQVALGLQHAFEQGMVHRDIKPQNLMLTPKGQVKILDFGLAKVASECGPGRGLTASGAYMGTPEYSAPEQATDARTADIRADLYSLGCTLYCLLAGHPPFQEDTAIKNILAHVEKAPPPLPDLRPDVPAALWAVVARLLAKDPAGRYEQPAEVARALVPFIKPAPKAPAPPAPAAPTGTPSTVRGPAIGGDTSRTPSAAAGRKTRPPASRPSATAPQASPFAELADPTSRPEKKPRPAPPPWWKRRPVVVGVAGATAVLGLVLLLGVVIRLKTQDGVVVLENVPADAEVFVDGRKIAVTIPGNREPVRVEVPEGRHELKVTAGAHEVTGEQVTVRWGRADPLKVTLGPKAAGGPGGAPAPKAAAGKVRAYKHGDGRWRVEGDELIQEDANTKLAILVFGDPSWADYDVTVEAQRIEGAHFCSLGFRVESLLDYWNFIAVADMRRINTRVDGTIKMVQSKGWRVDDEWHKLGVKARGERLRCFMDEELIFDLVDGRHSRGGVMLSILYTATRCRNLRVTDASGRVLVDGVRGLEWAAEQGDPAADDPARPGTVWKGKWRQNLDGKDIPDQDALLRIRKREGTRFEGEYWALNETIGLRIEGTIDGLGNISWMATDILAGTVWAPSIRDVLFMGAIKGKQLRAYGYFGGPRNHIAEVTLTRDD